MNKLLTKIVGAVLGTTMAVGVGVGVAVNNSRDVVDSQVNAAESFSQTFGYSDQGSGAGKTWTLTNCADKSDYWLCPDGADTSVAYFPGIFSGKTIASNVVITINNATYGSGSDPSSNTFKIFNSQNCSSQVTASQTGSLPTSKSYVNTIYTVTQANSSSFSNDLAIQITKPGKQIRFKTVTVEFSYTSAVPSTYSVTYDANGATSGDVPTDGTNYSSGATVTVKGNTGSLAKTGFTWAGWNTQADGNGTDYAANATFSISTNTTLYAKWIKTLDAITAIGGTVVGTVSNAGTYNWDFSNVTVIGTLSGVSGQNVKSYVDLSSTTVIPGATTASMNVSVTATKKEGVTGSAAPLTNNSVSGSVEAAKLTYSVTFSYAEMWSKADKDAGRVASISYATETSHPKTSTATCAGHESIDIGWASNNVYNPNGSSDYMQFRANQTPKGYIYNTTEFPGTITGVTYNSPSSNVFSTYYGDAEHPTSGTTVGGKYFTIVVTASSGTNTMVSATVTFEVSDKPRVNLSASNMNLDVASGAVAPTITDGTNPVSGYDLTSNDSYIASVTGDKKIQPVGYGKATITVSKAEDSGHVYLPTTFTVTVGDNSKQTSIKEFTEAAGGSATATDGVVWTITANQSENAYDDAYGINYGTTDKKVSSLVFTTPAAADGRIIKNVVVECMSALSGSTISVSVGEDSFTCSKSTSLDVSMTTYNFSGNASGAITITISGTASTKYGVKSIAVLYVGDAATSFASAFLGAISCDADGINKPTFTIKEGSTYWTWSLLESEFNSLSAADKAKFAKNAAAVNDTITAAIARYDYIVGKYYVGGLDTTLISSDFMNRSPSVPSGINRVDTQSARSNNATVATVVIISVISLSTLCGYFLLRKRKEER